VLPGDVFNQVREEDTVRDPGEFRMGAGTPAGVIRPSPADAITGGTANETTI
jgi:hypothetical protein